MLYSFFNRTFTSPTAGNGIPTQNTARAFSSAKSKPSLTLPRYTARKTAPFLSPLFTESRNFSKVGAKVEAPGSSHTTVLCFSIFPSVPSSRHRSTTRRMSEYLGRNTNTPPGMTSRSRYFSRNAPSARGVPSASCAFAVKSPSTSDASTWICVGGTTCGASTLMGNGTPSSPSSEPIGESVPLVTTTHRAASETGRNETAGRRHHSPSPAFAFASTFLSPPL